MLVSGGTPLYNIIWSDGITEDLINVGAGTYIVTVTDSRNCSHVDSVTITEPGEIYFGCGLSNLRRPGRWLCRYYRLRRYIALHLPVVYTTNQPRISLTYLVAITM